MKWGPLRKLGFLVFQVIVVSVLLSVALMVIWAIGAALLSKVERVFSDASTPDKQELCLAVESCDLYLKVRQECAVAGDFENCVRVKMGARYYSRCPTEELPNWALIDVPKQEMPEAACWLFRNGLFKHPPRRR